MTGCSRPDPVIQGLSKLPRFRSFDIWTEHAISSYLAPTQCNRLLRIRGQHCVPACETCAMEGRLARILTSTCVENLLEAGRTTIPSLKARYGFLCGTASRAVAKPTTSFPAPS